MRSRASRLRLCMVFSPVDPGGLGPAEALVASRGLDPRSGGRAVDDPGGAGCHHRPRISSAAVRHGVRLRMAHFVSLLSYYTLLPKAASANQKRPPREAPIHHNARSHIQGRRQTLSLRSHHQSLKTHSDTARPIAAASGGVEVGVWQDTVHAMLQITRIYTPMATNDNKTSNMIASTLAITIVHRAHKDTLHYHHRS